MQHSTGYEEIVKEIDLHTQLERYIPIIDEREIVINKVTETNEGVEINVSTDRYLSLDKLFLKTATGEIVPSHSIDSHGQKTHRSARWMYETTYVFDTEERPEVLIIEGVYYKKIRISN